MSGDFDDFTDTGIYGLVNIADMTNKPSDAAGSGILVVYSWNVRARNTQYLLSNALDQLKFYVRSQGDSGWGEWKKYSVMTPIT